MLQEILQRWWPWYHVEKRAAAEFPYSFQVYVEWITAELKSLDFDQLFKFCIWCASRLLSDDKYVRGLSQDEVALLHEVVEETWSWAEKREYPDEEYAKELRDRIRAIGPEDPVAAIETDFTETNMIGCVELVLDFYLTRALKHAVNTAHCMVAAIDCEEQDAGNRLALETMFLYPPMKAERDRQAKMIERLRNDEVRGMSIQELSDM
jgi:hypothetical protein